MNEEYETIYRGIMSGVIQDPDFSEYLKDEKFREFLTGKGVKIGEKDHGA
jgi:hypothetical protein